MCHCQSFAYSQLMSLPYRQNSSSNSQQETTVLCVCKYLSTKILNAMDNSQPLGSLATLLHTLILPLNFPSATGYCVVRPSSLTIDDYTYFFFYIQKKNNCIQVAVCIILFDFLLLFEFVS